MANIRPADFSSSGSSSDDEFYFSGSKKVKTDTAYFEAQQGGLDGTRSLNKSSSQSIMNQQSVGGGNTGQSAVGRFGVGRGRNLFYYNDDHLQNDSASQRERTFQLQNTSGSVQRLHDQGAPTAGPSLLSERLTSCSGSNKSCYQFPIKNRTHFFSPEPRSESDDSQQGKAYRFENVHSPSPQMQSPSSLSKTQGVDAQQQKLTPKPIQLTAAQEALRKNEKSNSLIAAFHKMSRLEEMEKIPYVCSVTAELTFRELKHVWNSMKAKEFTQICQKAYEKCENPLCLGLFLMLRSPDFNCPEKKNTLCEKVLVELQQYLLKNNNFESFSSPDIQKLAFHLSVMHKRSDLKKLIAEIFRLSEILDYITKLLKEFPSEGLFKEAIGAAIALELFCFDIHTFVFPLILQDRVNVVEEYFELEGSKKLREDLILFLDRIAIDRQIRNWLFNYIEKNKIDLNSIMQEKLNGRTITKLVKRFANKYNIHESFFPNICCKQKFGELRHIFHKKFNEADGEIMGDENFKELVAMLISNDANMTVEAIRLMIMNAGLQYAADFVQLHNVPHNWIPLDVWDRINAPEIHATEERWDEDWETQAHNTDGTSFFKLDSRPTMDKPESSVAVANFYALPFSEDNIHIVSNCEELNVFFSHLELELKSNEIVLTGIDSEWKPVQSKSASLLQVAFRDKIFLIDILTLKNIQAEPSPMQMFLTNFFAQERVVKIGYDVKNDFKMLSAVCKEWASLKDKSKAILDMKTLQAEILKRNGNFFPSTEFSSERGLCELVRICLQKSLSKNEQFSDWERRPLRNSQIVYAAADAFCLLDIFDYIHKRNEEIPVGLENMVKSCQKQQTEKEQIRKPRFPIELVRAVHSFVKPKISDNTGFNEAKNVTILCDKMLEGLARHLRSCGVKTVIIAKNTTAEKSIIADAKQNGAFVVTRGKIRYSDFLFDFSPEQVLYVHSDSSVDQVLEIFDYFKIVVDELDEHTVCWSCNSNTFIEMSNTLMGDLLERKGYKKSKSLTASALESVKQRIPQEMITYVSRKKRNWSVISENSIDIRKSDHRQDTIAFTPYNVPIEINKIPVHLFEYMDEFYVCKDCGKCYWSSKELENFLFNTSSAPGVLEESGCSDVSKLPGIESSGANNKASA